MRDVVICYVEAQDPSLQRPFLGKRGVAALFFVLFIPHMIMCDDEAQRRQENFNKTNQVAQHLPSVNVIADEMVQRLQGLRDSR